jgi:RNA polymerase sigma factor (sigma-70 family)
VFAVFRAKHNLSPFMSDDALVCAAWRGAIIEKHLPLVESIVDSLIRGRQGELAGLGLEREDLVSEGMIGLVKAVDSFNPLRGATVATWITTKVRGAVLDALGGTEDAADVPVLPDDAERAEAALVSEPDEARIDARLLVEPALATLYPHVRRAIKLHFLEGLSRIEVAREMNMSRVHVGRLINQGLADLRRIIGEIEL